MNNSHNKKYIITNKFNKLNNQIAGGMKEIYFIRHGKLIGMWKARLKDKKQILC
jgi:hypothetical protein